MIKFLEKLALWVYTAVELRDKYAVYRDGLLIARAKNWREAHQVINLEKQDYPDSLIYCNPIKR